MVVGQLLRYCIACEHFSDFCKRAKALTDRLLRQGFSKKKLKKRCWQFVESRRDRLVGYRKSREEIVEGCFSKED